LSQAKFLDLLSTLAIPWDWKKQLHGSQLDIIGFSPLIEWQRTLGWASWALNVFPQGRWALQSSWNKIAGKRWRNRTVPLNNEVVKHLGWFADSLEQCSGRFLLKSGRWHPDTADLTFYTDACPTGLGVFAPGLNRGFHATFVTVLAIYYAEALAVLCALKIGASRGAKKIVIFTDSMLTVQLFSSHRPTPELVPIISEAISIMMQYDISLQVLHIRGVDNYIADALSRAMFHVVRHYLPHLVIEPLTNPPAAYWQGGHQE